MSKLIQWNVISLDGFFEGAKSWELDWMQSSFNHELEAFSIEQLRAAGMLLFGRVTYEGMAAYWQTAKGTVAEFMNSHAEDRLLSNHGTPRLGEYEAGERRSIGHSSRTEKTR